MNKNIKKVVAATVVAGLAVAPVAAQTNVPTAHAAEQAQTKHVAAKFVQNAEGNFVEVTATQDVLAAKVTISVDGKGQYTVSVGDLKKGETKLVPFNVEGEVGKGFAPKALPKTSVVADHVTISKTVNSHLVRATVSYKIEDGKVEVKPEVPGDKVDPGTPGDRPGIGDLGKEPGDVTPTPEPKPEPKPEPAPAPTPKVDDKDKVEKDETPGNRPGFGDLGKEPEAPSAPKSDKTDDRMKDVVISADNAGTASLADLGL